MSKNSDNYSQAEKLSGGALGTRVSAKSNTKAASSSAQTLNLPERNVGPDLGLGALLSLQRASNSETESGAANIGPKQINGPSEQEPTEVKALDNRISSLLEKRLFPYSNESRVEQKNDVGKEGEGKGVSEAEPLSAVPEKTEFAHSLGELVASGKWKELSARCETEFDSPGLEGIAARLWWIKCQLQLSLVPVSILAAPLDSASSSLLCGQAGELEDDPDARAAKDFAAELLEEIGTKLSQNGEDGLAVEFLSRASGVRDSSKKKFAEVLHLAISRAEAVPKYQLGEARANQLMQFRALQEGLGLAAGAVARGDERKSPNGEAADAVRENVASERWRFRMNYSFVKRIVGVLALLCFLAGSVFTVVHFRAELAPYLGIESATIVAVENVLSSSVSPRSEGPALNRISNLRALDALWYDIENGVEEANARAVGSVPDDSQPKDRSSAQESKPVVNTAGPIEPKDLKEILRGRGDAEEEATRRVVDRDFVKGFPGGDGTKGFPVYRFPTPQTYRIIASTTVMSQPSYRGRELQRIRSGDRVKVEEDLGPWLKLSSREGKAGYILAQDAVLEPDKRGRRP